MPKPINQSLFDEIVSLDNLKFAYRNSLKRNGKFNPDALIFSKNETYNLRKLRASLIDGTYQFQGYIRFPVYEPKERIVDAPFYKDKIVQLAINNALKPIYNPCFIYDSYACIDNKGTHKCVDRISHFVRKAKWEYGSAAYIIKIDIQKFFYSIDRTIMKRLLTKKIKCTRTLDLIYKIIDSAEVISPVGLPLGNTLSQICANIYMNELDQYCKRALSLKCYVRYADDIIIIVKSKDEAIEKLEAIKAFLSNKLNLKTNENKTKYFPISQGVNTIGFKIHATHRLLRNDSKKRIKRKARKLKPLLSRGQITKEKAEQIFNSWIGHAKHGCAKNFTDKLLRTNPYLAINKRGVINIDMNKVRGEDDEATTCDMP